jgi:hypothetical protein
MNQTGPETAETTKMAISFRRVTRLSKVTRHPITIPGARVFARHQIVTGIKSPAKPDEDKIRPKQPRIIIQILLPRACLPLRGPCWP